MVVIHCVAIDFSTIIVLVIFFTCRSINTKHLTESCENGDFDDTES